MSVLHRARGFGMLEVLVALVLVTSVGVAVILWVEGGLRSVSRLREEYDRMQAVKLSQDWMRSAPEDLPAEGEAKVGGILIRWKGQQLASNPQSGYPRGYGEHDIVLFQYQYQVFRTEPEEQFWFDSSALVLRAPLVRNFKSPI